jgi:eukaryotic-like serine/threonine-protein kinase
VIKLADRFVLESELGSGGMARVYLGRDEVLDRPVAIKVLNPVHGGTDIGNRFEREGRTAARLAHPNIVQVYDAGEALFDGRETSYIVMEYVPGGDLKELIDQQGRLTGPGLAGLGDEVCAGLAHAHERGVIHRDIKPHNILLDENGHAKVTDFGIARALDTTQATRTGSFLGTALYSSPEQLQGQKVTPKSDVYSLGVTLYQAAVGEPPFSGTTPIEIASQHVSKTPVPPRQLGADVSEGVQALILDCLAKHPDDRPTAEGVRSRLEPEIPTAAAAQPQRPGPVTAPTSAEQTRAAPASPSPGAKSGGAVRREGGRRRRGILAVVAILAVLAVVAALALPSLLGGGGGEGTGFNNSGRNNAQAGGNAGGSNGVSGGGSEGDQGSQGSGGGQTPSPSATASASPSASPQGSSQASSGNVPKQGDFTTQAAEDTVQAFYTTTSEGDYERGARLLTEEYRQSTFPNEAVFEGTFDKVESVVFIVGPSAEVSGDTATVTGETRATLDEEVQNNEGTWYLVQEDGRWKIDGWDVTELSSRPA